MEGDAEEIDPAARAEDAVADGQDDNQQEQHQPVQRQSGASRRKPFATDGCEQEIARREDPVGRGQRAPEAEPIRDRAAQDRQKPDDEAEDALDGAGLGEALRKLSFLVVQDIRLSETAKLAHVVLPATHFGEKEGTYTNRASRVQKLNQALIPPAGVLHDSQIFLRLLELAGKNPGVDEPSEVFAAITREKPAYNHLSYDALGDGGVALEGTREPA